MRRLALVAATALVAGGCSDSKPGEKIVSPTPATVVGTVQAPTAPKGNASAGKSVFLSSGCAACHTFAPAGTKAKIGPDLDMLATYAKKANQPLDEFVRSAIVSPPPPYVPPGFPNNVMPTTYGTSLSAQKLADLVAFLTHGS